jgi:hypothetical protein
MKINMLFLALSLFIGTSTLSAQVDTKATVDMIKANLVASQQNMKSLEWVETVTMNYKGEQKSKKQNMVYYSLDGKLTKVPTGATEPADKTPGGLRGKAAEKKKGDITDYMETAVAKIQSYLPPDPNKIQAVFAAGKVTVGILEPGKKFKLDFPDYMEKGDVLSVSVDVEKKMILAVSVNTYVDNPSEKVLFDVKYNALPDGTQYPATTTLDAQAKEVKVIIENSGFKKSAGH